MLNGLPYKAWLDGLEEERETCKQLVYEFNLLPPKERAILDVGKVTIGENAQIAPNVSIRQDTRYTRKAATLGMNTEYLSRLAITYG